MLARPDTAAISHWSTDSLAPQDRWAGVVEALDQAIVPISVSIDDPHGFEFHMSSMELGEGVSILHQQGSAHRSARGRRELARSGAHTYHFLVNLASSWTLSQRGDYLLQAGEGILVDSAYSNDLELPENFEVVHIKMDEAWLHRWVGDGQPLAGRRFSLQPGMGCALNLFAAQLCPHLVADAPMPLAALADKFGALLAMASIDMPSHGRDARTGLCQQILADIAQRCAEPHLSAAIIARDLHLSEAELHGALMVCGMVFGDALTKARCAAARRMLDARSFAALSVAEISARAGFADVGTMRKLVALPPGRR